MQLISFRVFTIFYITLNLSACGTMISLIEKDYKIYAGVTRDIYAIQEGGIIAIFAVIDLPLSFVLDTLMLPITLGYV